MPPVGLVPNPAGLNAATGSGIDVQLPKPKPHLNCSPLKWNDFFDKMDFLEDVLEYI